MKTQTHTELPAEVIEAIRSFPVKREIEHCGQKVVVSPFDFYAKCPRCGGEIKLRGFSGTPEIEDVFDAVIEWMAQPGASQIVRLRMQAISEESEE